nr:ribosomal protein S11 [Hypericum monogynum]
MARPFLKIGLYRKRRKNTRQIRRAVIHIQASFNNTIVTVTDMRGEVISWSSAGTCGFKSRKKKTAFAAHTTARDAIRPVQGMQRAAVKLKGSGRGRDAALRVIQRSGIRVTCVRDISPMPHNGCRPPTKRRTKKKNKNKKRRI